MAVVDEEQSIEYWKRVKDTVTLEEFVFLCNVVEDTFPDQASMAKLTGYDPDDIIYIARSLEDKGLLQVVKKYDKSYGEYVYLFFDNEQSKKLLRASGWMK